MKADAGRTDSGGSGRRTLKIFEADESGRRTDSFGKPKGLIRTQDGKKKFKADGNGRRTDPFGPLQGRIRTSDAKKIFESGRKRTADGALSSASRTNSDVGREKFLKSGRTTFCSIWTKTTKSFINVLQILHIFHH